MKKKVGIVTFHASYNYGSMLQAYALQQVILNMGFDCEIINFRTERQKQMYRPDFCQGGICERFKRLVMQFPYINQLYKKNSLFENFLKNNLVLSDKEYTTLKDLEQETFHYDYYISGSDQIWNTQCFDFDWAYFLPFVKHGKKIAYAPSMGPCPESLVTGDNLSRIVSLLQNYDCLSVREPRTADFIHKSFIKEILVTLDPTLLLSSNQWNDLIDTTPIIEGDYILLYSPKSESFYLTYKLAEEISKCYGIKVVLSKIPKYRCDIRRWHNFEIKADIGPKEFLNLCKNAKLVCCDSFHAVVFSILLQKPFAIVNGMKDSRITNLLHLTGLQNHSIDLNGKIKEGIFDTDFNQALMNISLKVDESIDYLKSALDV